MSSDLKRLFQCDLHSVIVGRVWWWAQNWAHSRRSSCAIAWQFRFRITDHRELQGVDCTAPRSIVVQTTML
jgi:hypothetical protein